MPSWILVALQILGVAETAAPIIEKLLSGIATYLAQAFTDLFGANAATKLEGGLATATSIVQTVEKDAPAVAAFISNTYTTIEDLMAKEPWIGKLLFSTSQIKNAVGVDTGTAVKLNEAAHANVNTTKK